MNKLFYLIIILGLSSPVRAAYCHNPNAPQTLVETIIRSIIKCLVKPTDQLSDKEQKLIEKLPKILPPELTTKLSDQIAHYPLSLQFWQKLPQIKAMSADHTTGFFDGGTISFPTNKKTDFQCPRKQVVLSPSKKTTAFIDKDGSITCQNLATGKNLVAPRLLKEKIKDLHLHLLSDLKLLLYAPRERIFEILDLETLSKQNFTAAFPCHQIGYIDSSKMLVISTFCADEPNEEIVPCIDFIKISQKPTLIATVQHSKKINAIAVHQSSSFVASASNDGLAEVIDSKKLRRIALFAHGEPVYSIAFNQDGSKLITGTAKNHGKITIWNISGKERLAIISLGAKEPHAPPVFLSWHENSLSAQTLWKQFYYFPVPEKNMNALIQLQRKELANGAKEKIEIS